MKSKGFLIVVALLSIAALIMGTVAFFTAQSAKVLALSEIAVEEVNVLSTPVLDEDSGAMTYLTMYDISLANMSGPPVILKSITKAKTGGGFLTLLKGENAVSENASEKAFVSGSNISTIKANPKLLKDLIKTDMGESYSAEIVIEPGETKVVSMGVAFSPFDENGELIANIALVSWQLNFSNGKTFIFRRGFPIYPGR